MKSLQLLLLPLFACFLFTQCTKNLSKETTLEVKFDEWTHFDDLRMQLKGIVDDSRCPVHPIEQIDCIWEGKADGIVATEINGASHEIPFSIMGLCDTSKDTCGTYIDTLGYEFQFISLNPYPNGTVINDKDYVLSVKVSKK
jgi:hypothetical protein